MQTNVNTHDNQEAILDSAFFKKVVIDSSFGGLQWQVNSGNLGGGGNGRNDDFTVTVDLHFKSVRAY